ncbi:MAG: hypothetical protein EBZ48_05170 [Proteobacteria bacterium]|nr:hypothetical protein [Pseudomonadota bacterium]
MVQHHTSRRPTVAAQQPATQRSQEQPCTGGASGAGGTESPLGASAHEAVVSQGQFLARKMRDGLTVVGITGASVQWSERNCARNPDLEGQRYAAEARMERDLLEIQKQFGPSLVVATHGMRQGIAEMVREICNRWGIQLVRVVSNREAQTGPSAEETVLRAGESIDHASEALVRISDQLWIVGQSERAMSELCAFQATSSDAWRNLYVYTMFGDPLAGLPLEKRHAMFVMS